MSKMGSHHPFGHLKHKLWLKERSRVKLIIWLPIIKSRELTWSPCVKVVQQTVGKLSKKAITLFQISSQSEVYTQSYKALKSQEFQLWQTQDSHLGVLRQKTIWRWASWRGTKYIIRGKVVASPQVQTMVSLVSPSCPWPVLAPKVLQLCTNHPVLVLCKSVWVVDVCHSS